MFIYFQFISGEVTVRKVNNSIQTTPQKETSKSTQNGNHSSDKSKANISKEIKGQFDSIQK